MEDLKTLYEVNPQPGDRFSFWREGRELKLILNEDGEIKTDNAWPAAVIIDEAANGVRQWSLTSRAGELPPVQPEPKSTNPFIQERIEREIKRGTFGGLTVKGVNFEIITVQIKDGGYRPYKLRTLAKQLTDLADAHEALYPPQHCAADDL